MKIKIDKEFEVLLSLVASLKRPYFIFHKHERELKLEMKVITIKVRENL